jgi:hypothetical protein
MKIYLVLLMAFFSIVSYSQEKSIIIHKKNSEKTIEVVEHKRIKVVTTGGERYWGHFTVVDNASIMMKGKVIPLNSIARIKKKSLFAGIAKPVIVTSSIIVVPLASISIGWAANSVGAAVGTLLVSSGLMIALPLISNNHPKEGWEYSIKGINESIIPNKLTWENPEQNSEGSK